MNRSRRPRVEASAATTDGASRLAVLGAGPPL
jgi:hypothetical protein